MANFPVVVGGVGSINPSGFRAVYIREPAGKWQTLGSIKEGEIDLSDFVDSDDLDQNKSIGSFQPKAKCKMMQASLTEVALLKTIVNGNNDFLFQLADSAAIPTAGSAATVGWVLLLASQVGCEGDLICSGTPKDLQYIELRWQGSALLAAKPAMVKAAIDDNDFASSADSGSAVFYAIGTYTAALNGGLPTPSHRKPCGVTSITLTDVAGGSTRTITPITGVKFEFKMLSEEDDLLRPLPKSVDISLEYDWMATDAPDLLVLNEMAPLNVNVVVTMLNAMVFTLHNPVGIQTKFDLKGGMSKSRYVHFTHVGKELQATLNSIAA